LFISSKSNPAQLYGKDLVTGRERRLSQNGTEPKVSAAFDPSGSRALYLDMSEGKGFLYSVPFSGGVPQRIAPYNERATPLDWASNGHSLLLLRVPLSTSAHFSVAVTGPGAKQVRTLVSDSSRDIFQAHFSPNARWITFTAMGNASSQVFIAPFHDGAIPASEWRPIAAGTAWDDKPRFSRDGLTVLFTSDRDGFRCIWGQRLTPDMQPVGGPFAVFHSHGPGMSIRNSPVSDQEISVGKGLLAFDQTEFKGNLWVLDPPPPQSSAHQ
ncbi:MAG: PD40 domain-containing protein, partial [Acidobacteriia bacterium]|nr:PD40 domain-containing protein [Terriglobia bacterium]